VSPEAISIRRNPTGRGGLIRDNPEGHGTENGSLDVFVENAELFERDEDVLLTDGTHRAETATIVRVDGMGVDLEGYETGSGLEYTYPTDGTARVLALHEVQYHLDSVGGLVKQGPGKQERTLARGIEKLEFEYLDSEGKPIATAKVEETPALSTVRVAILFRSEQEGMASRPRRLVSAVTLAPRSGTVDFEQRAFGFRLSRVFYPIQHPIGLAARPGRDWAAILAAGASPTSDPGYIYTFPVAKEFLSARVDDVVWLDDVRAPVAVTFGPESGPLRGSLFVAAWGLRIGHISRIFPDPSETFSAESETITFHGTDAIAQAGGIAFGVDDALYVTSREKGAIYRFRFDEKGTPSRPERMFAVRGTPGAIVEGTDGHLYFLINHEGRGSLWKMEFDETLSPVEPALIGPLPGSAISMARDPLDGNLFALVRTAFDDFQVVELRRSWVSERARGVDADLPEPLFSLDSWQTKLQEGDLEPRELPFSLQELAGRMGELATDELDFVAFDDYGSLYLGSQNNNLVLKFELDRPSGLYTVGLSATVEESASGEGTVTYQAWKKRPGR
jgi:hypothetical protein